MTVNRFVTKLARIAELNAEDIEALTGITARQRRVPAFHDLILEGDRPGPVFVVLEGWACRYKLLPTGTRQILAFLMPGDACDLHIGLLGGMDHSIQTITPALVATIDREPMEAMMDAHRSIARAMYIAQLIDEGVMRAWITSMGRRSSIERVAHLMCELYIRARTVGIASENECEMPFSQIMLADAVGMTPIHLNRVLKELREGGAMELRRQSLVILDPNRLTAIAGFDDNYLHRRIRQHV